MAGTWGGEEAEESTVDGRVLPPSGPPGCPPPPPASRWRRWIQLCGRADRRSGIQPEVAHLELPHLGVHHPVVERRLREPEVIAAGELHLAARPVRDDEDRIGLRDHVD